MVETVMTTPQMPPDMQQERQNNKTLYRELVHSPAELGTEGLAWAQHILTTPGVEFGVPCVDKEGAMNPMHAGDMTILCGRPGMGKTSMLATLARVEAKRIQARGTQETEAVFYVTWEQVTEEINMILDVNEHYTPMDIMRGRADMDKVIEQSIKRVELPIWVVGDSMARTGTHSLRMYPDVVFEAIETAVEEYGVKPTLLCFDYIQLIPVQNAREKVMQVTEAAARAKEVAKRVGCPAVVGAQARREVDDREFKIPTQRDAQWASAVEQNTDKFFGLWRPWLTDRGKDPLEIDGKQYPITEDLLVMEMSKQRFGPAGHRWGLHFKPQHLTICQYELDRADDRGVDYDY
jgi:replicative DNA helicase